MRPRLATVLALWLVVAGRAVAREPLQATLPDGVKVIAVQTYSSPTVSINIFLRAGSRNETPDTTGMAHFNEHLSFRGTPTLNGFAFKKAIESLGGTTDAETSRDMTHFYINMPSRYFDQGLQLLVDGVLHATLTKSAVEKTRKVVLQEYRLRENNPGRIASQALYAMAYPHHPYGRPVIGTVAKLESYTAQQLRKWRSTYYMPDRMTVVVVGEVDPHHVLALATKLFQNFTVKDPDPEQVFAAPKPPSKPDLEVRTAKMSKTFVMIAYLAPAITTPDDVYPTDLLSFLMGVGDHSLLNKALVDTGLAQGASVDFLTQRDPGLFIISAVGATRQADQIRQAALAVVKQVQQGHFTDKQLQRARNMLINSYRFGNDSNEGLADSLGFYATLSSVDFALTYADHIKALTRADVIRVARKYLGHNPYELMLEPAQGRSDQ